MVRSRQGTKPPAQRASDANPEDWGPPIKGPAEDEQPTRIAWVRLGDGRFFVRQRFVALVQDEKRPGVAYELTIEVPEGKAPRIIAMHIVSGDPITGTTLRETRIKHLVKKAVAMNTIKVLIQPDGTPKIYRAFGPPEISRAEGEAEFSFFYEQVALARERRGGGVKSVDLQRVADIYRAALARGEHPTKAVAVEMPGSRSSAGRWVQQARNEGLLGPTTPGRAGELKPRKGK